jgi:hypothetical protein
MKLALSKGILLLNNQKVTDFIEQADEVKVLTNDFQFSTKKLEIIGLVLWTTGCFLCQIKI